MHPTLTPVSEDLAVSDAAISAYKRQLNNYGDFDYRNAATIGVLESILKRLWAETDASRGTHHLADAVAVLIARHELAEEEHERLAARYNGGVEPNATLPPGVEGWSVGGRTR
jgi:hypothetical protein